MTMTLALNYGRRAELIDAFQSIVRAAANNGGLGDLKIDEDWFPGTCTPPTCRTRNW